MEKPKGKTMTTTEKLAFAKNIRALYMSAVLNEGEELYPRELRQLNEAIIEAEAEVAHG